MLAAIFLAQMVMGTFFLWIKIHANPRVAVKTGVIVSWDLPSQWTVETAESGAKKSKLADLCGRWMLVSM